MKIDFTREDRDEIRLIASREISRVLYKTLELLNQQIKILEDRAFKE